MYELPARTFTFYYMELALEAKLQRKVKQLKEILAKSKGQIQYDWKAVQYIQSREQFIDWKQTKGGNRKKVTTNYNYKDIKKENDRQRQRQTNRRTH